MTQILNSFEGTVTLSDQSSEVFIFRRDCLLEFTKSYWNKWNKVCLKLFIYLKFWTNKNLQHKSLVFVLLSLFQSLKAPINFNFTFCLDSNKSKLLVLFIFFCFVKYSSSRLPKRVSLNVTAYWALSTSFLETKKKTSLIKFSRIREKHRVVLRTKKKTWIFKAFRANRRHRMEKLSRTYFEMFARVEMKDFPLYQISPAANF